MAARGLHSDHINLLIFRYLQEVGFETSANAFHRDWHRPPECYDPEHLPFAREVRRNELVSVIQTGLYHDDLQSRVRKGERRFRWTAVDARESVERRDATAESGASSRPPSSNKRKGRPTSMRAPDGFPAPVPKRQRRSEGSDTHINGEREAMDVDAASPDADEEGGDVPSPAMQSDTEQLDVMERYDSMDVATQTVIKAGPKTSTMYWRIDKPGASVMHSIWNPDPNPKNARTLLTVGESLCRIYQVPESIDDAKQISHIDDPSLPNGYTVTASAWRPDGQGASCAAVGIRQLPDDSNMEQQSLVELNRQGGVEALQLGQALLEPAGIVLSLRYSPDTQYLLATRTNGTSSLVQIWKAPQLTSNDAGRPLEPIAWRIFEAPMLDAAWTADDAFLICGGDGLSAMYQVDPSQKAEMSMIVPGTIAMRGLISLNSNILNTKNNWDRLRFDHRHRLAVFAASDEKLLLVTSRVYDSAVSVHDDVRVQLPEAPQALAFKPWDGPEQASNVMRPSEAPSTLAAAFGDGTCVIYNINRSSEGATCTEVATVSLLDGPALALAWSPNGEHLAVGNAELVQIWNAESFSRKNGILSAPQASVIWRPASDANSMVNGEPDTSHLMPEPSLSWTADGESLAFAADKQIAIIRFRPSLVVETPGVELSSP